MSDSSQHRKIAWTAEDRARHRAIREKFQTEKPTLDELIASGDTIGPLPQRVVLDLMQALGGLKAARTAAGLSLADMAE